MMHSGTKQDMIESAWNEIKTRLEDRKAQVFAEIRNYPPPITACDEQFDHLLAQQEKISRELRRADELATKRPPDGNPASLFDKFITSSDVLDAETKRKLKASWIQTLSNLKT